MILLNLKKTFIMLRFPKKKNFWHEKKRINLFLDKLIVFLYSKMIGFHSTDKVNGIPLSRNFVDNFLDIKNNTFLLHHSHITGEIKRFAHNYCNQKVREN